MPSVDLKKLVLKELKILYRERDDLVSFVSKSERFPRFLSNFQAEIVGCEMKLGVKFQKKQLDFLVRSTTKLFAENVIRHRDESFLTVAERNRRERQASRNADDVIGELSELGVVIEKGGTSEAGSKDHRTEGPGLVKPRN